MGLLTGFAMNPARDIGPKPFAWLAGWGNVAFTGGKDIPYFLVPCVRPSSVPALGAFCYRKLIGRNLPCDTCVVEEKKLQLPYDTTQSFAVI
jgi:glycerol uptake facilitator protein